MRRGVVFGASDRRLHTVRAGRDCCDPFSFRSNIILTGDYVLAGGPMNGPTTNGYTTTTITIPSLPSGATAVAAYLYWGSIVQQKQSGRRDGRVLPGGRRPGGS
jgi:hypothetical protein